MGKVIEINKIKGKKHFCSVCNDEYAKYDFIIKCGTMKQCCEICEDCLRQIKEDINVKE